jgi:hypothetical protein
MSVAYFEEQRREMIAAIRVIAEHLVAEVGKTALDDRVLRAMAKVPRHEFVPIEVQPYAYLNRPLPIGFEKTISQPLMVAVMTDLLELKPDDVVLEIGTGMGYQSAVLAELAGSVYTVEIIDELAQPAFHVGGAFPRAREGGTPRPAFSIRRRRRAAMGTVRREPIETAGRGVAVACVCSGISGWVIGLLIGWRAVAERRDC